MTQSQCLMSALSIQPLSHRSNNWHSCWALIPITCVMQTTPHVDGLVHEYEQIDAENKDLLGDTDYPAPDAEQKALKKDYCHWPL
jgi:hypothetical protein